MNIPQPEGDTVLQLALESNEVATLLGPILNNFSDVGWCFIDRSRADASLVSGPLNAIDEGDKVPKGIL
jgi:hypothetical protein